MLINKIKKNSITRNRYLPSDFLIGKHILNLGALAIQFSKTNNPNKYGLL